MSLNPFSLTSILKQHILLMSPLVNINSKSHRGVTGYNCGTRECSQLFSRCNAPTLFKINMPHTRSKRILGHVYSHTLSLKHVVCFHNDSGDPPSTSGHCPLLSIPDYNRYSLRAAAARWLAAPVLALYISRGNVLPR